ncbi:MAG TPA: cation transporting ATPase C-terminal domain-containing protein, partial [Gemmataceae bacterium]|nr:cation transporting ATPase C-terminal domain-containing protein [Gemmataceae bacterium]
TGAVMGAAGLALFLLAALAWGDSVEVQRTLLLSLLVVLGLANLYRVLPGDGHRLLRLWPVLALLLYAGVMYIPPAANFFLLVPLGAAGWGVVLAFAAPAFLLCLATDWLGLR